MNRRDLLGVLGLAATSAWAGEAPKGKPAAIDSKALAEAAHACVHAGDDCIEHCITMLSNGDKSMADCFAAVQAMRPAAHALAELARLNNPNLKAYAAVCAKLCRDCEKACKPHAGEHPPCKACMDACAKTAALCEKAAA